MRTLAPLYYMSPKNVDQLYRRILGDVGDKTITRDSSSAGSAKLRLAIGKLVSFLGIPDIGGEAELKHRRGKVETIHYPESVDARALSIIRELLVECHIPNLLELQKNNEVCDPIYWYSLPTRLAPKKLTQEGVSVIEVSYESDGLTFNGFTSFENWISPSLRSNLLISCAKAPDQTVNTFGIVSPVRFETNEEQIALSVHFIVIGHPSIGEDK